MSIKGLSEEGHLLQVKGKTFNECSYLKDLFISKTGQVSMFHFPSSRSHKPWFNQDCR